MITNLLQRETSVAGPQTAAKPWWRDEPAVGLLVVRLIIGAIFVGHGAQKLFGAFNGGGISGTAAMFNAAGYQPATPIALLAGLIEFGGGLLLILGLGASAGAAAIAADMAGATAVKISAGGGAFFATSGGFEYELVLALVAFGLILTGAGRLSFDHGRPWDVPIVRRGLAALAIIGAVAAVLVR